MIDRIILGDNQFFGINHMSEQKASALSEKFMDLRNILNVIDAAYDCGIRALMLNTNDRAKGICDYLRENSSRYSDFCLYPSMPYAHKYANSVAQKGIFTTIKETIISGNSFGDIIQLVTKGGSTLFEKDMIKVMQLLVDVEMKMFRGLQVKVIFLQNIVTDLLLGFCLKEIFMAFSDYVQSRYGIEAGFITMNMPRLLELLLESGMENPIVCSAINKSGYLMNPDIASYEAVLRKKSFRPIAMSIMASGAIVPEDAVRYVSAFPSIGSIVFGASSEHHLNETKQLIERYSGLKNNADRVCDS